jgi:D-alanyl-D-alanine carboxypeptidase (penicillin-binding protein 5/6)
MIPATRLRPSLPPRNSRFRTSARLALVALLACGVVVFARTSAPAAPPARPPRVDATAAVLMDARSGRVLFTKSADLRWSPASTTKILTALLAMEALSDEALVQISARASVERSGSAIGLETGERWKARDLLYALLMHSANDAAVALAEGVAGSVEQFAEYMNARATTLGARRSKFVSPHGRFHPNHVTTAHDLAVIARAALRTPRFAEIVRTQTWNLIRLGQPPRMVINTNSLLWRYRGADGVKTGWIAQSGPCLVASATRDGWQLIAVVLNAPRMYRDAAALLDYGFGVFAPVRIAAEGEILHEGPIVGGASALVAVATEETVVPVRRGMQVQKRVVLSVPRAPVRKGQAVGTAVFSSEGREVARVKLIAADDVRRGSLWSRFVRWMRQVAGGRERRP